MRTFLTAVAIVAAGLIVIFGFVSLIGLIENNEFDKHSRVTKIPGQNCYILEQWEQDEWDGDVRNKTRKVVCE